MPAPSDARSGPELGPSQPASWAPDRVLGSMARLLDIGVLCFGAWTLLVHFMVFVAGAGFGVLRWAGLGLLPVAYFAHRATRSGSQPRDLVPEPVAELARVDRALHFLIACALVLSLPLSRNYLVFWGASFAYFAVMCIRSRGSLPALMQRVPVSRGQLAWFLGLLALSAVLTMISHRPDTDDGFLINVPVWTLDNPSKALYSEDGMHDIRGIPIVFPTYRAHTVEILYAFLAWALHIEPIAVAHLLLPPLASVVALMSSALLLRVLLPRAWVLGATALVAFWITMGDVHEGFANHAYVRIFQGKAVLVTALLPYLAFAVIRFMTSGRALHWILVFAAVVSAAGLSATGLFVGPLALGAAACACWAPTRTCSLRLATVLGCAAYPLAIALVLRTAVLDKLAILNGDALYGHLKTFPESLVQILGMGPYLYLHLLGLLGACALAPDVARRRWLAALGLVYCALVMNPFLYETWVHYVTSAPVAWRLWWMAPLPILVAMTLAAPFAREQSRVEIAMFAVTLVVTFTAVPSFWSLSARNGVSFSLPRLKVPLDAYALSESVQRLTPKGYSVLVPREIAMWVTTRRGHPRVVAHKENTLKVMEPYMGKEQFNLRMHLFAYVSGFGRGSHSAQVLAHAIDSLHIGLVARSEGVPWGAEIDGVMSRAGFLRKQERGYVLWYRAPGAAPIAVRDPGLPDAALGRGGPRRRFAVMSSLAHAASYATRPRSTAAVTATELPPAKRCGDGGAFRVFLCFGS